MNANAALDDEQARVLEILHSLTTDDEGVHATMSNFTNVETEWTRLDVRDLLKELYGVRYADLSGAIVGGWRCTRSGRQVVRAIRKSRSSGPERVLQWVLQAAVDSSTSRLYAPRFATVTSTPRMRPQPARHSEPSKTRRRPTYRGKR